MNYHRIYCHSGPTKSAPESTTDSDTNGSLMLPSVLTLTRRQLQGKSRIDSVCILFPENCHSPQGKTSRLVKLSVKQWSNLDAGCDQLVYRFSCVKDMNVAKLRVRQIRQRVLSGWSRVNSPVNRKRALRLGRLVLWGVLSFLALSIAWIVIVVIIEIIWGQRIKSR